MDTSPLISVIVPVYKAEKYLEECVRSIRAQEHRNLEIILIDDGSPDNCPQMCDDFAREDARIRVIYQENGGVSAARNAGIAAAKGEWIGFVDADDVIHASMYKTLHGAARGMARTSRPAAWSGFHQAFPLFARQGRRSITRCGENK